ncbi:MAG: NAD(P)/FAD-dependent oxidoreductase, partial [Rhizomicrobium sp.]
AERETDPVRLAARLTFVIIGGGPTGVELAGAIAELARSSVREFRNINTHKVRVILIEAGPRILPAFEEKLADYAKRSLEKLGIEVYLGTPVTECSPTGVVFGGQPLTAKTIVWAAGVQASPAAQWLDVEADRAGRIKTNPDLTIPDHPEIFAIGDTAAINDARGKPVPGIAPAAKQQGVYIAKLINKRLAHDTSANKPFHYQHLGNLATIGKSLAVIDFGWLKLTGAIAWWMWGLAHIYFLIGVRNRLAVALSWLWIHFRDQRGSRLITDGSAKLKK